MKLIVGLGNPGEKFSQTRHNLGFMVLDRLVEEKELKWQENSKFNAQIAKINSLILVKPLTFMNASGFSVAKIVSFYKIKLHDLWVIHDDVDLPLGRIKIRLGGAAGGHRGVMSIIEQLGSDDFVRFRLGIGHPGRGADHLIERYVLENFNLKESFEIKKVIKKILKAIALSFEKNLERAMNLYN
jgi:PTH1 family peptidyl-tRNA hydrolase